MASIKYIEFSETVKSAALLSLSEDKDALCRTMNKLFRMAAELQKSEISEEEKSYIACCSGCGFCCRVSVPVLYPEAVLIASHLSATLSPTVLWRLMGQMESFVRSVAGYDEEERIAANIKCVFLGRFNECTIHDVRPFACRSVTSADPQACREALKMPLLGEQVLVPMNTKHKSINDSAFIGLAEALEEKGFSGKSTELVSAVLKILKN